MNKKNGTEAMEQVLIDERAAVAQLVEKFEVVNRHISEAYAKAHTKYGLDPRIYAGGLMPALCYKDMSLEENLNNLLAIFQNNFAESLYFQCRYIKLMEALRTYPQAQEIIKRLQK